MSSIPSEKKTRVLSCALCQARKVKCDRNSPCANCIKANAKCTPSTPAIPRKRRRPNQDLKERLARCEELLSKYTDANPPNPSEDVQRRGKTWEPLERLVIDDSGSKTFTDSVLWANVHNELQAMRQIIDDQTQEDDPGPVTYSALSDEDANILLSDTPIGSIEEFQPQSAQAIRLWQVFLDRVNPLTKVVHVPTLQPILVEAMTNINNVPKNIAALLLSIYLMAAVSMTNEESQTWLGYSRKTAIDRLSRGTRLGLMQSRILKSSDLVVLQTIIFYMMSLCSQYEHQAAWILNGVVVRFAQKIGLHRDGEYLGLSPFETELRRRIWWQIVIFDANCAVMSGLHRSVVTQSWDTKEPTNVNDSDLFPTMSSLQVKNGPTDMIFVLCNVKSRKLFAEIPRLDHILMQGNIRPGEKTSLDEIEKARAHFEEFGRSIENLLDNYSDASAGPVHEFSLKIWSFMILKLQKLTSTPREQLEYGAESAEFKDLLFRLSVFMTERCIGWYQACAPSGNFLWFATFNLRLEVLIYMVGQLGSRHSGSLVESAWAALELIYTYHEQLFDLSFKPHASLAYHVLRVWRIRQSVLSNHSGGIPATPGYILKLEALLPSSGPEMQDSESTTPNFGIFNISDERSNDFSFEVPWDQMFSFFDAQSVDWGDLATAGNQTQMSYGNTGWRPSGQE